MSHPVKVYGVGRCPRTRRAMALLDSAGVGYHYFDLDADRHAAAWVRWRNGDAAPTPTVMVGSTVLANPADADLRSALADARLAGRASVAQSMN